MVHIYNGMLLRHKKEKFPFATTWMTPEIVVLSDIRQRMINII